MNREDFDKLVEETMAATAQLLIAKGAEYAGGADRLINFKRKNGQTVLETWQTHWGKHVDSINTYMARVKDQAIRMALIETIALAKKGDSIPGGGYEHAIAPDRFRLRVNDMLPAAMQLIDKELSEPIEGRFYDNINYSVLCLALIKELKEAEGQLDPRTTERT